MTETGSCYVIIIKLLVFTVLETGSIFPIMNVEHSPESISSVPSLTLLKLGEGMKEKLNFLQLFIHSCNRTSAKLQPYVKMMSLCLFILISRAHKATNLNTVSPRNLIWIVNLLWLITELRRKGKDMQEVLQMSWVPWVHLLLVSWLWGHVECH